MQKIILLLYIILSSCTHHKLNTLNAPEVRDSDKDKDGMSDSYEFDYDLNMHTNDAHLDLDEDGFMNIIEKEYATAPNDSSDYPSILHKVSVLRIQKQKKEIVIQNHLTGKILILKSHQKFNLKGKVEGSKKYKVLKVNNDSVDFIDYWKKERVTIKK